MFITAASALLATASPLEKRKYITEVQTYYEMITITQGLDPEPTPVAGVKHRPEDVPVEAQGGPDTEAPVVVVTTTKESKPEPEPTNIPVVTVTASSPKPTDEAPTPKQSPQEGSDSEAPADDDWKGLGVYHHNLHRANHSVPEVSWNDRIAGYASTSAAQCVFKHDM